VETVPAKSSYGASPLPLVNADPLHKDSPHPFLSLCFAQSLVIIGEVLLREPPSD